MSLLSAALCLWGIQTGLWFFAVLMIVVFEGRRFVQRRWAFSLNDLRRILKICGGLIGLLLIFLLITQRSFSLIYSLLQWLPICVFPLIAANTYSSTRFSALLRLLCSNSYFLQKGFSWKQNPIDLYSPYFALCLLSASATNGNGVGFYAMAAILVASFLWHYRPRRAVPVLWICLIMLASGMGFLGHLHLHQLQAQLEQQTAPWLIGLSGESVDPYRANTRIGSIGDLKQSNAIVFRVAAGDSDAARVHPSFPLLLREATYNKYGSAAWIALKSKFAPVPSREGGKIWTIGRTTATASITVSANLSSGKGILRLPSGTSEIEQLPAEQMTKNQYGTVKVEGSHGAAYQIRFNPEQSDDSLPTEDDLKVPEEEIPAIRQTLKALDLESKPSPEVLSRVSAYFEQNFRYSLKQVDSSQSSTPLSAFLLKNRSGHCEYFATAATLLLRELGIPARYAVGYSVHEFSPLEQQYIVRSRNAHAWVMAYVNGTWHAVDPTPPDWSAQEDAAASPLQAFSDFWSFLSFRLAGVGPWGYVGGAITLVAAFWLWKSRHQLRLWRPTPTAGIAPTTMRLPAQEGIDSEFYRVEQRLRALSLDRMACESLQQWLMRLQQRLPEAEFQALSHILKLHYRYRFDPRGIEPEERERLRHLSQSWLEAFPDQSVVGLS